MNRPLLLAALVVAGTVAWVLSGQIGSGAAPADPAAAPPPKDATQPVERVRVRRLTAQPMSNDVVLQGRLEAWRSVDLRTQVRGRVEEVLAEKGTAIRLGQPIARIAVDDRRVQLDQAQALLAQRRIERDAAEQLFRRGNGTETAAAQARAQFELAQASLRRAELDLANTEIRAPFDGVLDKRAVEVGDVLETGGAVATVVDLDPLRAVGYATERAVAHLKTGAAGRATVVGGTEAEGRIVYVAATADTATRTYRVELEIPNPGGRLAAGLTAQLRLPAGERLAYLVPPSALSLGDDGSIGVKVVDENRRARFLPAVIAATETRGAWLTGLPGEIVLIITGHEFVASGAPVEAVEAEGNPS